MHLGLSNESRSSRSELIRNLDKTMSDLPTWHPGKEQNGRRLLARLRPFAVAAKRKLFDRPVGLGHLGRDSVVAFSTKIVGRKFVSIGERSAIRGQGWIIAVNSYAGKQYTPSIVIADDVYIGGNTAIWAVQRIEIANGCVLSNQVYLTDFFHGFDPEAGLIMQQELQLKGPVYIGPHCFLGFRVSIMPGVTLGERCIVGANSVVTRSFPAYSMIVGSPARLVKTYSHELKRWIASSESGSQLHSQSTH
jgi:acetyltransferase-like isoleucine patch superfamily enzyme